MPRFINGEKKCIDCTASAPEPEPEPEPEVPLPASSPLDAASLRGLFQQCEQSVAQFGAGIPARDPAPHIQDGLGHLRGKIAELGVRLAGEQSVSASPGGAEQAAMEQELRDCHDELLLLQEAQVEHLSAKMAEQMGDLLKYSRVVTEVHAQQRASEGEKEGVRQKSGGEGSDDEAELLRIEEELRQLGAERQEGHDEEAEQVEDRPQHQAERQADTEAQTETDAQRQRDADSHTRGFVGALNQAAELALSPIQPQLREAAGPPFQRADEGDAVIVNGVEYYL